MAHKPNRSQGLEALIWTERGKSKYLFQVINSNVSGKVFKPVPIDDKQGKWNICM